MRLLAGVLLLASTLTGSSDPAAVVDGWKTSPVYVDPTQRSLVSDKDAAAPSLATADGQGLLPSYDACRAFYDQS